MRYGKIAQNSFMTILTNIGPYLSSFLFAIATIVIVIINTRQKTALENLQILLNEKQEEFKEKRELYKKEAVASAKEQLYEDRQKLNDEIRERRQEVSRLEDLIEKKQDELETKIQQNVDKEYALNKKEDELNEKEDYLAETIAKQVTELERVSQMSREEARNTLLEQLKQELK